MRVGAWQQDLTTQWAELWEWITSAKWTHEAQIERMLRIANTCAEYGWHPANSDAANQLDDLLSECCIPFADSPTMDLWACDSEVGLIFVFASPEGIAQMSRPGTRAALYGWPGIMLTTIAAAHTLPADQIHPWGMAAERCGYLYWGQAITS